VNAAVVQGNYQLTTGSGPRTFSLPDVAVLTAAEGKTAATSGKSFSNVHAWIVGIAIE
jgi:hypothetical protein